jgi:hypothetical protein
MASELFTVQSNIALYWLLAGEALVEEIQSQP